MEKKKRGSSPAHVKAANKYNETNIKQYVLKLNVKTDADIIELFESLEGSRQGYIKELIRADMKKAPGN